MIARLRRAFIGQAKALAPSALVLWAPAAYPHRPSSGTSVVTLRIASGPTHKASIEEGSREPTVLDLFISDETLAIGQRITIRIAGREWYEEVGAGDSAADVRDRLQAQIVITGVTLTPITYPGGAWGAVGWGAVGYGADAGAGIRFDASGVPGLLADPSATGTPARLSAVTRVVADRSSGLATGTVELQAYAAGPGLDAHALAYQIAAGLPLAAARRIRLVESVAVTSVGPLVDLTALAGGDWESRAAVRFGFEARTITAVVEDEITELTYSINDGEFAGSVSAP